MIIQLTVMGLLVLAALLSTFAALTLITDPLPFITARAGIRAVVNSLVAMLYVLWFSYVHKDMPYVFWLAAILVPLRLISINRTISDIGRPPRMVKGWELAVRITSPVAQLALVSSIFGLAVAF